MLHNSGAFLMLYGIALATEGWGVVASLKIYPPFAGAAVSAITLVVSFGFAVSRPCLTLEVRVLKFSGCAIIMLLQNVVCPPKFLLVLVYLLFI